METRDLPGQTPCFGCFVMTSLSTVRSIRRRATALQPRRALFNQTRLANLIKSDDYLRSLREANIHQHVATYQHIRLGHKFSEAKSAHLLRHEDMVQPQTDPTDLIINVCILPLSRT